MADLPSSHKGHLDLTDRKRDNTLCVASRGGLPSSFLRRVGGKADRFKSRRGCVAELEPSCFPTVWHRRRLKAYSVKRALISDIHSNIEALEAVLADIRAQGISEIYCLGDLVGYGPNPREVIDEIIKCKVCLLGNHDQGALFDPEGFNSGAERAIFWTRRQLENGPGTPAMRQRRWDFLGELPRTHIDGKTLYRPRLGAQPAERVRLSRRHLQ